MPFPNPATQFKPGNKAGAWPRKKLTSELERLILANEGRIRDALMSVLVKEALKGDMRAMTEILDRIEGKPRQEVETTIVEQRRPIILPHNDRDFIEPNPTPDCPVEVPGEPS